jgi:sugar lactone lactonase YvrE
VLYRLDRDGTVTEWDGDIGIANTLAWSPDQRKFYFADTLANMLWVYDYDASNGSISNQRPFLCEFSRGLPDGSCVDAQGYLWNCRYQGGCVVRVAPDGTIDRVIDMPVENVTTCGFGGGDRKTLYITSARNTAGAPFHRLEGSLFAIRTQIEGQAENRFRLPAGTFRRG